MTPNSNQLTNFSVNLYKIIFHTMQQNRERRSYYNILKQKIKYYVIVVVVVVVVVLVFEESELSLMPFPYAAISKASARP